MNKRNIFIILLIGILLSMGLYGNEFNKGISANGDSLNCKVVGYYDTDGNAIGVYVVDNHAYVADYDYGLCIIDISDVTSPNGVGYYNTNGYAYAVYVSGNYAYVADHSYGLRVIYVGIPTNPSEVSYYDTYSSAVDVYVSGNYAYVADGYDGLRIIDISDPTNPSEVGYYNTGGFARGVYVSGDYIYVADDYGGLYIIQFNIMKLEVPNGNDLWYANHRDTIKWMSDTIVNEVEILYSTNNGNTWTRIDTVANTGEYVWTIPDTPSDSCKVKVQSTEYNYIYDMSDDVFTIDRLDIKYPIGGEYLEGGEHINIEWESYMADDYVIIAYSTDGGNSWIGITDSTDNDMEYEWYVPTDIETDSAKIKITLRDRVNILDEKESNVFSINNLIEITSPNGGEEYSIGDTCEIMWSANNNIDYVSLYYTLDNGNNWELINSIILNDGEYDWLIPDTVSDNVLIKIVDYEDSLLYDISDNVFSIDDLSGIEKKESVLNNYINISSINRKSISIKYSVKEKTENTINIYDISGRMIKEEQLRLKPGINDINIKINSSIYMIIIKDENNNIVLKKKVVIID